MLAQRLKVNEEESIVCDINIRPQQRTQTTYAMEFVNHRVIDPRMPQAPINVEFDFLADAEQLETALAEDVTSVNQRRLLVALGGSFTESWTSRSASLTRDEDLVFLGALFAFVGSLFFDLITQIGERFPSVKIGESVEDDLTPPVP